MGVLLKAAFSDPVFVRKFVDATFFGSLIVILFGRGSGPSLSQICGYGVWRIMRTLF